MVCPHTVNPSAMIYKRILAGFCYLKWKHHNFLLLLSFTFTWKLVVVVFAFKISLSNIAQCHGCGPEHCSCGTMDLQCFKFLIRQLVTLNKTKINCSMTARKPFEIVACKLWCEDLTCDWLQQKHSRHIYKHSCN